jgi:type III secretion system needle length determinant
MTSINPTGGAGGTTAQQTQAKDNVDPPQEDTNRFRDALGKKDNSSSSNKNDSNSQQQSDNHSSLFRRRDQAENKGQQQSGDGQKQGGGSDHGKSDSGKTTGAKEQIGQELMQQTMMQVQPQTMLTDTTAKIEAPPEVQQSSLNDMVNQIVDRITVGATGADGAQEVRIFLKDEVLGGTEIRISQNAGGDLEVTFVAPDKDIQDFLDARQGEIRTALGDKLKKDINVNVLDRDAAQNQQGDQRGQEQGQPDDGRSRNQRSVEDERQP